MIEAIKAELNKMKEMDPKARLDYFKYYYLKWTILVLFLIFCFLWYLRDAFWGREDIAYAGGLCHVLISEEGKNVLTEEAGNALGLEGKQVVHLTEDLMLSYAEGEEYNEQSTDVILFTFMAMGEYQYFLMDESVAEHIVQMDGFAPADEYAAIYGISEEAFLKDTDGQNTAFRLPADVCDRIGISGETGEIYIGFILKNKNDDFNKKFLSYLMAE